MVLILSLLITNSVYAVTTSSSMKITEAKTITATASIPIYTITWSSRLADSSTGSKTVEYTDKNGIAQSFNPYSKTSGTIYVKGGTPIYLCMTSSGTNSHVSWEIGYANNFAAYLINYSSGSRMRASYTPTHNGYLTQSYTGDMDGYTHWGVMFHEN